MSVVYRVVLTDDSGYSNILAEFPTKEQAQRFIEKVKQYIWHPENVKLDIEEVPYDWLGFVAVGIPIAAAVVLYVLYRLGVLRF